jgi:Tol biopolymer transport system component
MRTTATEQTNSFSLGNVRHGFVWRKGKGLAPRHPAGVTASHHFDDQRRHVEALTHRRPLTAIAASVAILLTGVGAASTGCGESTALDTRTTAPIAFLRQVDEFGEVLDILTVDADGSGLRKVTRAPGVLNLAWSPDGRRIAFDAWSDPRTYYDIFVINRDGTGKTRLASTPWNDWKPVWSPDGRQIAFDRNDDGPNAIWIVNADGSKARRLTPGIYFAEPEWSPDGRTIGFTDRGKGVYTMAPDGSSRRRLVRSPGWLKGVAWSPNGQIAFVSDDKVVVVNADGSGRRLIELPTGSTEGIVWSPDGRRLALEHGDGDWEIFVMDADGENLRNLTANSRVHDRYPSWSPDGRAIAFTSFRDGNAEIYVMNSDGSGQRRLTQNPAEDLYPVWSHDPGHP